MKESGRKVLLFLGEAVRADKNKSEAPPGEGEEEVGDLQVEGKAVKEKYDRNPVEVVGNHEGQGTVTIHRPVPRAEDSGG